MQHNDKVAAIKFIRPNSLFVLKGDELEWLDKTQIEPTEEEIKQGFIAYKAKLEEEEAEAVAKREATQRKLVALGLDADDLKTLGL